MSTSEEHSDANRPAEGGHGKPSPGSSARFLARPVRVAARFMLDRGYARAREYPDTATLHADRPTAPDEHPTTCTQTGRIVVWREPGISNTISWLSSMLQEHAENLDPARFRFGEWRHEPSPVPLIRAAREALTLLRAEAAAGHFPSPDAAVAMVFHTLKIADWSRANFTAADALDFEDAFPESGFD